MEVSSTPAEKAEPNNNGVPLEGEGDPQEEIHHEVVVEGGDGQLSLAIGGKNPNVSKVLLRGGALPFNGQVKKGDHVKIEIEAVCSEIHVIDKIDSKTRETTEVIRKHVLKVEGARVK